MQIGSVVLPNPEWGDSRSRVMDMKVHRMMDNTVYTYVRKSTEYRLSFTIPNVKHHVFVTLKAYLLANMGSTIVLIDQDSVSWTGYIVTNPNSITFDKRGYYTAVDCSEAGDDVYDRETGTISLEFEGHLTI